MVIIEMAKIICCHCNHEMFLAHIYQQEYYMQLVCSECNNLYLVPKPVEPIKEEEVINVELNNQQPTEQRSEVLQCDESNQESEGNTSL